MKVKKGGGIDKNMLCITTVAVIFNHKTLHYVTMKLFMVFKLQ